MFPQDSERREEHSSPTPVAVAVACVLWMVPAGCETDPDATPRPAVRAAVEDRPIAMKERADDGKGDEIGAVVSTEPWTFGGFDGQLVTTPTHLLHLTLPEGRLQAALPIFTGTALRPP